MKSILKKGLTIMRRDDDTLYDENVDYDALDQTTYPDQPGRIYYRCPRCGGEYLAKFIVEEDGIAMCIDCWSKRYG